MIAPQTLAFVRNKPSNEPLVSLTVSAGCSGQTLAQLHPVADPRSCCQARNPPPRCRQPLPRKNRRAPSPRPQSGQSGPTPSAKAPPRNGTPRHLKLHPRPLPPAPSTRSATRRTPQPTRRQRPRRPEHHRIGQCPARCCAWTRCFCFMKGRRGAAARSGRIDDCPCARRYRQSAAIENERLLQLQTQLASLEDNKRSRAEIAGLTAELAAAKAANTLPCRLYLLWPCSRAALLAIASCTAPCGRAPARCQRLAPEPSAAHRRY